MRQVSACVLTAPLERASLWRKTPRQAMGLAMSDVPRRLPPKKEVATALLEEQSLFVHLDPRREGVVVPKWFMGQPQLVLQVGLNMAIQIPDLAIDDSGVTCTLSFNRSPFWCHLPWSAVYALVGEDGRGMIWPNDVPPEVSLQMQQKGGAAPPAKPAAKKGRTKLAAVGGDGSQPGPRSAGKNRPRPGAEQEASTAADPGKIEETRPTEAERRPRRVAALAPARSSEEATGESHAASPPAPAAPAAASKKPRRELPPYLRVVK